MSLTWSVCSLSTTSSVDLLSHCLPVCSREVNRRHEPHHDCMWAESVKLSPPFLNKVVKHKRTGLKSQQSAGWIWLAEDSWCQQNVPYAKIVNVHFDHMTFALWVMKLERKHLKEFLKDVVSKHTDKTRDRPVVSLTDYWSRYSAFFQLSVSVFFVSDCG